MKMVALQEEKPLCGCKWKLLFWQNLALKMRDTFWFMKYVLIPWILSPPKPLVCMICLLLWDVYV